jgi:RNA polymerase sigma-70 factor, ECF subfamily
MIHGVERRLAHLGFRGFITGYPATGTNSHRHRGNCCCAACYLHGGNPFIPAPVCGYALPGASPCGEGPSAPAAEFVTVTAAVLRSESARAAPRHHLPKTPMRKGGAKTVIEPWQGDRKQGTRVSPPGGRLGRRELDQLFSATYEELRRLAASVRRGDPSATLTPTALVNEAWLKLARAPQLSVTSELHFKRIAARAMRQLLVEAARRRLADKRGGKEAPITVSFGREIAVPVAGERELLQLDAALEALAQLNPRQAEMVESRLFGGLDVSATAALLQVSEATMLRDWRAARAWHARELRAG